MISYLQYLPYIKETQTKKKNRHRNVLQKNHKGQKYFYKKKELLLILKLIHERGVQPIGTVVIPTVVYASCC